MVRLKEKALNSLRPSLCLPLNPLTPSPSLLPPSPPSPAIRTRREFTRRAGFPSCTATSQRVIIIHRRVQPLQPSPPALASFPLGSGHQQCSFFCTHTLVHQRRILVVLRFCFALVWGFGLVWFLVLCLSSFQVIARMPGLTVSFSSSQVQQPSEPASSSFLQ